MKTPPAVSRAGLETNEPDLSCRPLSSRNQLAAPHCAVAASLCICGREGEHDAKLEHEARRVKMSGLAQARDFVIHRRSEGRQRRRGDPRSMPRPC
jgi:hypothetical protein